MDMIIFGGRNSGRYGAFKDIEASKVAFSELQTKGYVRYEGLPLQTRDGRLIDVEFVSNVYLVDHQKVIQCNIRDITERKQVEEERKQLILQLQKALSEVKTLKGIFPICASCKKIRDDKGYWNQIEAYIRDQRCGTPASV